MVSNELGIRNLIEREGWEIDTSGTGDKVVVYGEAYPIVHPVVIHLKLYRELENPDLKYKHMKAAHDYLWPAEEATWNYWAERCFRTHCEDWKCVTYAGGSSIGKSYVAAKIADLFWLANPKKRAVLIMSTTLESLNSRIYGYCTRFLTNMAIELPFKIYRGNNPRVSFPGAPDNTHCMAAVAAKKGSDDTAISGLIGRHPQEGMLVIADEGPDMPPAILGAIPNLSAKIKSFQLMCIGNSSSKFDLHGALSTPKIGWDKIDPMKTTKWETTQDKGVCLFFNCYESPAIHETDLVRKAKLSKIFLTEKDIDTKKKLYGEKSSSFWRFVIGYWRDDAEDPTIVSMKFLDEFHVRSRSEWSGIYPLQVLAGLDPAFSTGGDKCILRLLILGQDVGGRIVADFRRGELSFTIPIKAMDNKSAELQIADAVINILRQYNCPIANLCIDANGQGRALGEVIKLRANVIESPYKIYSTKASTGKVNSFDVIVKSAYDLWVEFRNFIQTDQIRGLDDTTIRQLTTRLVENRSGRFSLESKHDYKIRMGAVAPSLAHSPDEADSASLALQAAILRYGFVPGQKRDNHREQSFELEKFHAFQQAKVIEERHKHLPPVADFSSSLEDLAAFKKMF